RELGTAGKKAVPGLVIALRDNDKEVRTQARKALGAIGPAAVPELCRALDTKNQIVRNHVVTALAAMGPDARKAVPALAQALKDRYVNIRTKAAYALGAIG